MVTALNAARAVAASGGTFQQHYIAARNLMDAIRGLQPV